MGRDPVICYPVNLSVTRSVLKHTWIENGILNKGVTGIVDHLWRDGRRWQALDSEFATRECEAERFGLEFTNGFCSTNLVELIAPLVVLPPNIRDCLRKVLDALYRSDGSMANLQIEYMNALATLRTRLAELRMVWDLPRPEGIERVRESAIRVIEAATELRVVMERIPKGVVIP